METNIDLAAWLGFGNKNALSPDYWHMLPEDRRNDLHCTVNNYSSAAYLFVSVRHFVNKGAGSGQESREGSMATVTNGARPIKPAPTCRWSVT